MRCPRCHRKMHYSETAVLLDWQGTEAIPPVWLCEPCWLVLPVVEGQLKLRSSRSGGDQTPPTVTEGSSRRRQQSSG